MAKAPTKLDKRIKNPDCLVVSLKISLEQNLQIKIWMFLPIMPFENFTSYKDVFICSNSLNSPRPNKPH